MFQNFQQKAPGVILRLMQDFNLTDTQAAGIVGNVGRESGGFTLLREIGAAPGHGGYGWCQWTGARATLFLNWCRANKLDWRSDTGNYGYLKHELSADYAYVVAHVRETRTVADAAVAFEKFYERAGVPALADRIAWAQEAETAYRKSET